jgi:hypothetical protein
MIVESTLKRFMGLGLALLMLGSINSLSAQAAVAKKSSTAKVGICTSTVSQGEDEYRAAQMLATKYPGRVVHVTYPDNFMQEQETTISVIESLASDKNVKAIIIGQGVPGTIAAIRKIKRKRPEIVFISWQPHEDPDQISKEADLIFENDNISRGKSIPALAKKLGAKKLIHYSFPRHMSYKMLGDRRDMMMEESKKQGIEFLFVTAPDPLAEGGIPAAQQFMLEDVPKQVQKHGKDTAFFNTNDAMTEPMIKKVAETGAIFPEADNPSPTMGFPGAFGIKIPKEKAGDYDFINSQIKKAVAKYKNTGRMAAWPRPASIVSIMAAGDLMFDLFDTLDDTKVIKNNLVKNKRLLERYLSDQAGTAVELTLYQNTDNFQMILMENVIY